MTWGKTMAKNIDSTKDWKDCKTCGSIPAASSQFVKGGEFDGPGLPSASITLEIVGAPFFDDSTSGSNSCIKRCPECGSVFRWANEYEYLVNGSEDDTSLVRLSREEGEKAVADTLHAVDVKKKLFQVEGTRRVHLLKHSTVDKVISEAAGYLEHGQLCYNEDLTFAVPAMVGALVRHEHNTAKCYTGMQLFWSLSRYAGMSKGRAKAVLDSLQGFTDKPLPPEVEELVVICKKAC
jgi:hypothetical protein